MKKFLLSFFIFLFIFFSLTGCNMVENKNSSLSIIYAATTLLSIILLFVFCFKIKKKCSWYYLLFSSIAIVNAGYLAISVSTSLEEALLANRIAYIGSAFLPLAMLMIIWRACNFNIEKYLVIPLLCITTLVFCIAASPGYSDVYYKSVELSNISGVTVLKKEYGPLHSLYMYYLILYFGLMSVSIIIASHKKKIQTKAYVTILLFAVLINLCVWLMGQLVSIDFEFLSISYIICGLFLLCFEFMKQSLPFVPININQTENTNDNLTIKNDIKTPPSPAIPTTETKKPSTDNDTPIVNEREAAQIEYFKSQLITLTVTEREIYNHYLSGKSTKEIMSIMGIKETTLKYHNRNLYGKLGVISRKQLIEFARKIQSKMAL